MNPAKQAGNVGDPQFLVIRSMAMIWLAQSERRGRGQAIEAQSTRVNNHRFRRDGRVDDGGGLENRYAGDCIVGSNPTPSATLVSNSVPYSLIYATHVFDSVILAP